MQSTTITTMTKMMEHLPEYVQSLVVKHMNEYISNLKDELQWDELFQKTQNQILVAAQQARKEISEGLSESMDFDK